MVFDGQGHAQQARLGRRGAWEAADERHACALRSGPQGRGSEEKKEKGTQARRERRHARLREKGCDESRSVRAARPALQSSRLRLQ